MAYDPYDQSQDSYPYGQGGQYLSPQYPPSGYDGYGTQQPQMPPQQMGMGVPYGMPMMGGYPARNGVATTALVLGIVAQTLFFLMLATAMANANDMVVGIIGPSPSSRCSHSG